MKLTLMRDNDRTSTMRTLNTNLQIEVNHLVNRTEVNRIKLEVSELPQTFAAFMGSGRYSVKIWVRFTRPDGRGYATLV